jgi:hypothetical protein
MHSLTLRRSGLMPCHGGIDTRRIQEHTRACIHLPDLLLMEATLGLDRFTVTLGCLSSLFVRVRLRRTRVRCILDRLGLT